MMHTELQVEIWNDEKTRPCENEIERLRGIVRNLSLHQGDVVRKNVARLSEVEVHPFAIFPEEVWKIIFSYLQETSDALQSVCLASSVFGEILNYSKPVWLFEKVLPLIGVKKLKKSDVLNCRLVCKKWKTALDTYMEDHPSLNLYKKNVDAQTTTKYFSRQNHKPDSFFIGGIRFIGPWGGEKIDRFCNEMQDYHLSGNPIVGRCLTVNFLSMSPMLDLDRDIHGFYDSLLYFLEIHGHHIWHFGIDDTGSDTFHNYFSFYIFFRTILVHLVNLRTLEICVGLKKRRPSSENMFEAYLGTNPLPAMAHLRTLHLEFDNIPDMNRSEIWYIQNMIMSAYSTQLESLRFPMELWSHDHSRSLENLTELVLDSGTMVDDFNGSESLEALSNHAFAQNLRRLDLRYAFKKLKVDLLMKLLENFPSLVSIRLVLSSDIKVIPAGSTLIKNDNILILDVDIQMMFLYSPRELGKIYTNIIYNFPQLQYLRILQFDMDEVPSEALSDGEDMTQNGAEDEGYELEELLCTENLHKSNIWTLLPNMKEVSFRRKTREKTEELLYTR